MPEWLPMFALPNIETRKPIEVDGFALVSIHDERLQQMAKKHRRFGSYLKQFKTEFGEPIIPSIFIWRDDAPQGYRGVDAIAGFRDAIAMSVIPQSWAKALGSITTSASSTPTTSPFTLGWSTRTMKA